MQHAVTRCIAFGLMLFASAGQAVTEGYRQNYFLFAGADDLENEDGDVRCDGKFQISFTTPLRNPTNVARGAIAGIVEKTGPLYFGYTQRAFWELCQQSFPFSETNYMPELFWAKNVELFGRRAVRFIGWEHQSNGRDSIESRSWDRIYARMHFPFLAKIEKPLLDESETSIRNRLAIDISLWHPVTRGRQNRDINDFYGFGELAATYTFSNQHRLKMAVRKGGGLTDFSRGNLELQWLFPSKALGIQWMVQAFNGYGESLQQYNVHSSAVRFGVVFSDYEFKMPGN